MIGVRVTKEDAQKSMKQLHLSDSSNYDAILQASLNVKKLFKNPDKIFGRLKLKSLLSSAQVSAKCHAQGNDFLVDYGNCLIQYFGKDPTLDSELLCHLKSVFIKLQKEHETVLEFFNKLCNKLEEEMIFSPDIILNLPTVTIEMMVLNWIGVEDKPYMALLAKISASSPKLFQTITSVLSEALIRTSGHEKVLEVTNEYVQSVKNVCLNEKKDFLKLYPKNYCQIVSLLNISPEQYSEKGKTFVNEVLLLLYEVFLTSRQEAFILLSHYSKWVSEFKAFLYKNASLA